MLFAQYRDGAPVTRTKLSEHLSKIAPELKRAKVSSYIVAEAQVKFNEIFGIEMKELSRKAQKKTGAARTNLQASEPTKEYVLKSLLPSKMRRQFIDREEDHTFRGFVMAVVALVSVSGGEIEENPDSISREREPKISRYPSVVSPRTRILIPRPVTT